MLCSHSPPGKDLPNTPYSFRSHCIQIWQSNRLLPALTPLHKNWKTHYHISHTRLAAFAVHFQNWYSPHNQFHLPASIALAPALQMISRLAPLPETPSYIQIGSFNGIYWKVFCSCGGCCCISTHCYYYSQQKVEICHTYDLNANLLLHQLLSNQLYDEFLLPVMNCSFSLPGIKKVSTPVLTHRSGLFSLTLYIPITLITT
jgi:hypothetical protein